MKKCPVCSTENQPEANFCMKCAHDFRSTKISCPSCGGLNTPEAKFCIHCRTPLTTAEESVGCIKDGKWHRGVNEVVRRVDQNELKKAFSFFGSLSAKSLEVPLGSICAVVENGVVVDVLPPGRQTTKKWFEDLFAQFEQSKTVAQLYLISRQSIGFPVSVTTYNTTAAGQAEEAARILITGNVGHTFNSPKNITAFLNRFVGEREVLTLSDIQNQLRTHMESLVKEATTDNRSALVRTLSARLKQEFQDQTGLQFHVRVTPQGTTQTIGFHFGLVDVPSTEKCRSCHKEVQWGSRFCIHCKTPNIMRPKKSSRAEEIALITQDGQHIELDTTFSISGAKPLYSCEAFAKPLAEKMANVVRGMSLDSLKTKEGLESLEHVLRENLSSLLVGYEVLRSTILDLRSKKEGWLFKSKADMEQVRLELSATKQWLAVGAEEQDMEREVHEFIASRTQMERELALVSLSAELEYKRARASIHQEDKEKAEEVRLSAAEASFVLSERRAKLEERKAELAASTELKDKERLHIVQQELALIAHESRVSAFSNQTAYNRMVLLAKQEEERMRAAFKQEQDTSNQAHTQKLAASQTDHNIQQGKKTGDFTRGEDLANAQNQAAIDEIELKTEMSGLQAKSDLKKKEEDAKLARELKKREDDRKGIQQKADIAKDLLESKQKHELEKAEARQRLVNSLKGQSIGSIMALAAAGAGRALTDAESASIAKIESGEDEARVKLLTDFLEKNDARDERLLALLSNQSNATAHAIAGTKVEEAPTEVICPQCNTKNPPGAKFCQTCGADF